MVELVIGVSVLVAILGALLFMIVKYSRRNP
jgi:hypothetical protein